jgi:hypothetical protein
MNELDDDMLDEGPLQCDLEESGEGGPVTPLCPDRGGSVVICTRGSIVAPNVEQPDRVKSVVSSIVRGLDSAHPPGHSGTYMRNEISYQSKRSKPE